MFDVLLDCAVRFSISSRRISVGNRMNHRKREFGRKALIIWTEKTRSTVKAMSFTKNVHDGHALPQVLEQT